jgi:RNA polymerase sigma-70 factor, ECF subfamily
MTDIARLSSEVLSAAQNGDQQAYEVVLRCSARELERYFTRRIFAGSGLEAEDLMQDCLLALHAKWHTYDVSRPYLPWLRAIAAHKLIDALRRRKQGHLTLESVEAWLAAPEAVQPLNLSHLLGLLPPDQQEALTRVKLHEQSVAQVATSMNRSEGSVKQLVHRGLTALRKKVAS